jgi:NADPH-dependent 2,4-dienoyl-CoA reductase/sulfur reductase-like enzyme/rhodanese-related sulfurtransferase
MAQRRLLIVGGVAAGATAAARARRLDENAEIIIFEKGKYVSFANCGLPYRISGDIEKRSALLLQTPEGFFSRYRVEVRLGTEALEIDRASNRVRARGPEGEFWLEYDSLILAQGGTPFAPPIAGLDSPNVFKLWTIPDMDGIHAYIDSAKPQSALVIGGGFIGLEAAEAFVKRGLSTTIVELTDHLMPPADAEFGAMIAAAFEAAGARVIVGRSVARLTGPENAGSAGTATLDDGTIVPAGVVLVSAGVKPNLDLARAAGLAIGSSGGLSVDEHLRTSDPRIWAAGDMIEVTRRVDGRRVRVPLAGPANRQGRIAATNALGGSLRYAGALGTSVFKVLDKAFAMTGLSEKAARDAGFDIGVAVVHRGNHASYYPGSSELSLELVYERKDGRLLGAQAFGESGVEKRIDIAATALAARMTVDDLAELDLAYAPPFSSANDPLNMAAFVAQNELSGYSPVVRPVEALALASEDKALVLDVRGRGEYAKSHIAGSLNIPLDELRDSLGDLGRDRPIVVASRAGFEGHLAARQLIQAGFGGVAYISGGMRSVGLVPGFVPVEY